MLGTRYDTIPIPPVPENTRYFPAGAVTIGLEFRILTDDIVDEAFASDERQAAVVNAARPEKLDDKGFSLHVNETATGKEYLRFDLFENGPHYHYIVPGEYNLSIDFDPHACGDPWDWAIERIRNHLPPMLRYAGATDLADAVDPELVAKALDEIIDARQEAMAG